MERESFEDDGVAAILNDGFVSVKVDREERPDVDHIYMEVCQALTGSGGWPLTVLLTPDKKPFFAGTYFPKESKWGRPGLTDVLRSVISQWRENSSKLAGYGDEITRHLLKRVAANPTDGLSSAQLDHAYADLERYFDGEFGGFSSAPKFPTPHNLLFLLYYWRRTGKQKALSMVEKTLAAMRQGGIYDHLGFGFCRYSTDDKWLAPHFEKMLYDNALLCYTYLEAHQATDNAEYAQTAEEIIEYVLHDMTSPYGAFYSAEDADSEGVEGLFYLWTKDEIVDALGWEQGCIFADYYHVSAEGNFENGKSILHAIGRSLEEYAAKLRMNSDEFTSLLAEGRNKLYDLREKRVRPFRDDKVLTSWNALMIAALAKASKVLQRPEYLRAAESALRFIETRLTRDDGRILARFREEEAAYVAYLDDYAFLLWAQIELYEATFDTGYVRRAMLIAEDLIALFADQEAGGFFFTGKDAEELLVRPKELYDGAIPSGNSVAAFSLLKLSRLTGDSSLLGSVEALMDAFTTEVRQTPRGYVFFLLALDLYLDPPKQIVIAGSREDQQTESMLASVQQFYMPEVTLLFRDINKTCEDADIFVSMSGKEAVSGQTAAYVCDDAKCLPPITELEQFQKLMHDLSERNNR